jgi:hypothetical protein
VKGRISEVLVHKTIRKYPGIREKSQGEKVVSGRAAWLTYGGIK